MNKIFLHLWLFALCGSLLHSCSQNEAVPEVEYPENEMESPENEVKFQASEGASRSFIEGNHLSTANTTMCIYGYKDNVPLGKGDKVLTGKTLMYNGTAWSVVDNTEDQNPITYYWEGNGKYRFFGWLTYDANSRKTIPKGLTLTDSDSDGKFTITDMVINKDYSQFDFLYSNINYRELTSGNFNQEKTKSVAMEMNHLFTAFAIGIKNTSEDDIVIKSVKLNCVHDKGSAVIDFSKSVTENVTDKTTSSVLVTAQYGTTSKETRNAPFIEFSGNHTIKSKEGYAPNIFAPSAADKQFYMVWPQQGTVLNATGISLGENDEEEDEIEANERDANSPLLLEYTVDGVLFKKRLRLPNENWLPGKKYYLEVQIADKLVEVTSTVKDWYYTDSKVDFSQQSVSVKQGNHLMWDPNTCYIDHDAEEVEVTYGNPAVGTFKIDAPQGGQWKVSLVGDITAFQIVDFTAPTNDGQGPIDGKSHSITIVPLIATPERDYKVTLKFVAITIDRRTFAADDMIQDIDNDGQADIYTIVQRRVK